MRFSRTRLSPRPPTGLPVRVRSLTDGRLELERIAHGARLQRPFRPCLPGCQPFPRRELCCLPAGSGTMTGSDSLLAGWLMVHCPSGRERQGKVPLLSAPTKEGLSSSSMDCPSVPRPLHRRVLRGCVSQLFTPSLAFAAPRAARLPLVPPGDCSPSGHLTTRQTSLNAADRKFASLPF